MVMTGELNWLFWTVGGLLGLAGLCLLYWALLADRSKGRKRCPKCWYNMSHTPSLTCSECGYTAKREKNLCKTHRRWRWAVVAVVLLLGSASSSFTPKAKRDGWISIIPTTALLLISANDIELLYTYQSQDSLSYLEAELATELVERIIKEHLWVWQWRLLVYRLHPEDDASWVINSYVSKDWPIEKSLYALIEPANPLWYIWLPNKELRIHVTSDLSESGNWSYEEDSMKRYNITISRLASQSVFLPESSLNNTWNNPSLFVGNLPEGQHTIELKVTLAYRNDHEENWNTIWEGGIEHAVKIHGTIDDLIQPATRLSIEDDLQPNAIKVSSEGVSVAPLYIIALNAWSTLALNFDLVKDNKVIRSAEAWWTPADLAVYRTLGGTGSTLIPWNKPISLIDSAAELSTSWELRVREAPELALRAKGTINMPNLVGIVIPRSEIHLDGDFIPGEVTYKLLWIDAERYWIVVD